LVLALRLIQGLALGGEYGGAATYVAEHAPAHKRGYYTSWIQTTATLGLFVALGVILLVRSNMTDAKFDDEWGGWRYPFWISIVLVIVSVYIRLKMKESPLFAKLKKEGKTSVNRLKESFNHKANFKMVLLALFGAVMGQGVIWYTGQFYAQSFLETKCNIEFAQSRTIMLWAIALATPFFLVFGWLSDKIGRKWIMLMGMLLGVICYRPIFQTFLDDTSQKKINSESLIVFTKSDTAHKGVDSIQEIKSVGKTTSGIQFTRVETEIFGYDTIAPKGNDKGVILHGFHTDRHPKFVNIKLSSEKYLKFVFLVWIMIIFVTMVYGPIAAFLVELFPTKIRYTSMSLPYHIGNGVFGGLVPFIGLLLTTMYKSDPLVGLWYPIGVAALCFIIGTIYLKNQIDKDVTD
jgi:MFS family permease